MSKLRIYALATRPWAFPAAIIPVLLGGVVAVTHANVQLNGFHYILTLLTAVIVQGASNTMNDIFDVRKGVDRPGIEGSSRGMYVMGLMSQREVVVETIILWALAAASAVYFVIRIGPMLLPLILGGFVLGFGYTLTPTVWKYRGLGDLCVFGAFGVGLTLGSYVVQTGSYSWVPVAYSIPIAILIAAILHGNNLRDIASDRAEDIRTLAMMLGERRGRILYLYQISAAYLIVVVLAVSRIAVWSALLPLLSLPLGLRAMRGAWPRLVGGTMPREGIINLDMRTAQLQMVFGLLLILGTLAPALF